MGPERAPSPVPPVETASLRPTSDLWHHLWVPAIFALLALQLRQDLVFLLGALMVGCALAAWPICRRNLSGLTLTRQVPRRARAGEPTRIGFRVENRGARSAVGVEVHEGRSRAAQGVPERLEVPCLDAGRDVRGSVETTFPRRGRHTLPGAWLSSRFPLGVFRARGAQGPSEELLVWPREGRPTALLLRRLREAGEPAEALASRQAGVDDLFGLREQREGDDQRRIRWRASARAGRPVVAEWRARRGHDAVLVLGRGADGDAPAFERAVSVAATAWRALRRTGRQTLLLADGAQVRSAQRGFEAGLDLLASARARAVPRTAVRLRRLAAGGHARHVIVVCGTAEDDLLSLARAAAGRGGSVTRVPVELPESARWVGGLA